MWHHILFGYELPSIDWGAIFVSIITGLISGWVVTIYYRKKDEKREIRKYINGILGYTVMLDRALQNLIDKDDITKLDNVLYFEEHPRIDLKLQDSIKKYSDMLHSLLVVSDIEKVTITKIYSDFKHRQIKDVKVIEEMQVKIREISHYFMMNRDSF